MKSNPDERMMWIRNLEGIRKGTRTFQIEHEVGSEAQVVGVLNYGDQAIVCGPLTLEVNEDGLYKYLLKMRIAPVDYQQAHLQATHRGYVLRAGLVEEMVALLSVALEARFFVLSSSSGEPGPQGLKVKHEFSPLHRRCSVEIDPILFGPRQRSLTQGVAEFLDQVAAVDPHHHQELILSFYHYSRALREIGLDEEMVFIRLVSAIECLARSIPLPSGIDILSCRPFEEIVRVESLSPEEIREAAKIFDVRLSKCRFVNFLCKYSKGFFKGGRWEAPHTRIKKMDLPEVAEAIYDARSSYLHQGDPMYLSSRIRGEHRWHTDPSVGMIMGSRKFRRKEKLPYSYWFHSLVRHCLLQYMSSLLVRE